MQTNRVADSTAAMRENDPGAQSLLTLRQVLLVLLPQRKQHLGRVA